MPHATMANRTDGDRAGVAYHFLRNEYIVDEKFHRIQVTGPEATGGQREFGVDVSAAWEKEIDAILRG